MLAFVGIVGVDLRGGREDGVVKLVGMLIGEHGIGAMLQMLVRTARIILAKIVGVERIINTDKNKLALRCII